MSKFKVGDFLRNLNNNLIGTVDSICDDAYYSLSVGYIGDDISLNVELWKQQVGEFVVKPYDDDSFIVQRYKVYDYTEYDELEPFIGKLPSWIKD